MGYGRNVHGTMVLACDACGGLKSVRKRTCPHLVVMSTRFGPRVKRTPWCQPPALCPECFHGQGGTQGVHAGCAELAALAQAQQDALQARLDAGDLMVFGATTRAGLAPPGMVLVSFMNPAVNGGALTRFLVPEASYDTEAKRWLSDYPDRTPWSGPQGSNE